jgi:hypothetical protein
MIRRTEGDGADHADGQRPRLPVVEPCIRPFERWPVEQHDRQIERQATLKVVAGAFRRIPLE